MSAEPVPPALDAATASAASPRATPGAWPLTLYGLGALLLERRRLFVLFPLSAAVLASSWALVRPRTYTSSAAFVPRSTSQNPLARYSGLAAQLGVGLPIGDASQSPEFYAGLLKSRQLLGSAVESRYRVEIADSVHEADLVSLLRAPGRGQAERKEAAVRMLDQRAKATRELKTGVVRLEVRMPWATLAQQVATRMLELLDQYNRDVLRSQASAERSFVEGRLAEARQELASAEDRLLLFLQRNREYRSSPELSFAVNRLERDVTLRQQLVTSLAQAYDQARIDVVRNTPVIAVVGRPEVPIRPDRRGLLLAGLLGGLGGLAMALLAVITGQALRREETVARLDSERFAALWRDARPELQRPWRLLRPVAVRDQPED